MRLIDADELIERTWRWAVNSREAVQQMIKGCPTIDAEPVRHGRWIYKGVRGRFPVCECSVCGNVENADWAVLGDNVNYCPICGAKMGGERRDENADDPD